MSSADPGTYLCQISFSAPSQSQSKSNKRMLERGSRGSSNFHVKGEKLSEHHLKKQMPLTWPCCIHTTVVLGKGCTFHLSLLHAAAAVSAGTPTQCEINTGIIFLFLCTYCVYPSAFSSRDYILHAAEDGLKTKPVLVFVCFLTAVKVRKSKICS